ncbi:unnamed protein product [Amoebophrya sp. A25]|nr:unnamed protein product [Amoebophrya sp. A25]|eukprot:GSA25T00011976001.1
MMVLFWSSRVRPPGVNRATPRLIWLVQMVANISVVMASGAWDWWPARGPRSKSKKFYQRTTAKARGLTWTTNEKDGTPTAGGLSTASKTRLHQGQQNERLESSLLGLDEGKGSTPKRQSRARHGLFRSQRYQRKNRSADGTDASGRDGYASSTTTKDHRVESNQPAGEAANVGAAMTFEFLRDNAKDVPQSPLPDDASSTVAPSSVASTPLVGPEVSSMVSPVAPHLYFLGTSPLAGSTRHPVAAPIRHPPPTFLSTLPGRQAPRNPAAPPPPFEPRPPSSSQARLDDFRTSWDDEKDERPRPSEEQISERQQVRLPGTTRDSSSTPEVLREVGRWRPSLPLGKQSKAAFLSKIPLGPTLLTAPVSQDEGSCVASSTEEPSYCTEISTSGVISLYPVATPTPASRSCGPDLHDATFMSSGQHDRRFLCSEGAESEENSTPFVSCEEEHTATSSAGDYTQRGLLRSPPIVGASCEGGAGGHQLLQGQHYNFPPSTEQQAYLSFQDLLPVPDSSTASSSQLLMGPPSSLTSSPVLEDNSCREFTAPVDTDSCRAHKNLSTPVPGRTHANVQSYSSLCDQLKAPTAMMNEYNYMSSSSSLRSSCPSTTTPMAVPTSGVERGNKAVVTEQKDCNVAEPVVEVCPSSSSPLSAPRASVLAGTLRRLEIPHYRPPLVLVEPPPSYVAPQFVSSDRTHMQDCHDSHHTVSCPTLDSSTVMSLKTGRVTPPPPDFAPTIPPEMLEKIPKFSIIKNGHGVYLYGDLHDGATTRTTSRGASQEGDIQFHVDDVARPEKGTVEEGRNEGRLVRQRDRELEPDQEQIDEVDANAIINGEDITSDASREVVTFPRTASAPDLLTFHRDGHHDVGDVFPRELSPTASNHRNLFVEQQHPEDLEGEAEAERPARRAPDHQDIHNRAPYLQYYDFLTNFD